MNKRRSPSPFAIITNLNDDHPDYLYHRGNAYRSGYSIMKKVFFILLSLFSSSALTEVFKCQLKSGKMVYQSTPCESAVKQETIEIQKIDPRKVAEEEAKLKAWKEDFAKREAARIKAEQALQAERDRNASVEALKKSADYQQQQAYEAKRQADALERQNIQIPYQQPFYPYYPSRIPLPPYPSRPDHAKEKTFTDTQRSEQTGLKLPKNSDDDSDRTKLIFKSK